MSKVKTLTGKEEGLEIKNKFGFSYKGNDYSLEEVFTDKTCSDCVLSASKDNPLGLNEDTIRAVCMTIASKYCNPYMAGERIVQFVFKKIKDE